MYIIRTKTDLQHFIRSGLFSNAYCTAIEEYFNHLTESLAPPGCDPDEYDLTKDGYIVVLQEEDNPYSLPEVGLAEGLMVTFPGPEFIEKEFLSDGTILFRMVFLYMNDYAMTFFFSNIWNNNCKFWAFVRSWTDEHPSGFYLEGGCSDGS